MGFLGILEDTKLPHVPGTVILNEKSAHSEELTAGLRHATGKHSHIVLAPQPSEDPNDPLNWSFGKKFAIILIIAFGACLYASTFGPLLNAGAVVIAIQFGVSITDITVIGGYNLLIVGASGPVVCACARKYGKRPVFFFSAFLGLIGTIVGATASGYKTLLAARIIQGLSTSAYESLSITVIGDLMYVHERGIYMAFMQSILGGVSNASSIITGPIVAYLGWKYLFYILLACVGLQLILLYLFVPETQFRRDRRYETDEIVHDDLKNLARVEQRHDDHLEFASETGLAQVTTADTSRTFEAPPPKKTFWQEKAMFTGSHSDENMLQLLVAPFAVCTNLFVAWNVVVTGTITATYVAVAFVLAQIFFYPPYGLSAAGIGYLSTGPFVGGLIAWGILSFTMDPIIEWCTRRNNGVYEPEYRLLPAVGGLFTGVGLFLFGYLAEEGKSYYATATCHGIALFGIVCVTTSYSAYIIDAYREMSNEIFIISMVYKNFLFYGYSYFINNWEATGGAKQQFYTWGGVGFFLTLTTPVLFIYGKKYRSYWARANLLERMRVVTHSEV